MEGNGTLYIRLQNQNEVNAFHIVPGNRKENKGNLVYYTTGPEGN